MLLILALIDFHTSGRKNQRTDANMVAFLSELGVGPVRLQLNLKHFRFYSRFRYDVWVSFSGKFI